MSWKKSFDPQAMMDAVLDFHSFSALASALSLGEREQAVPGHLLFAEISLIAPLIQAGINASGVRAKTKRMIERRLGLKRFSL